MDDGFNLGYLLSPESVAVIGASKRPGSPGNVAISNLNRLGFSGRIFPVNPKYEELLGIRCYGDISSVPENVDCALICLPSAVVPESLEKAAKAGARSAIIYASGFAETGDTGRDLQKALKQIANAYSLPICGPNCIGLVNFKNGFGGLSAAVSSELSTGRISAVCQSGSVAIAFLNSGRGLDFHHVVSSGNEAIVTVEDYIEYFIEDEETDVVLAFVESFRNIPKLRAVAARSRESGKPIIVLKVGRSLLAQRTVASHTGALAGVDAVLNALCRQCGIIRVTDMNEMLETASLFRGLDCRQAQGEKLGMMAVSGGEIGLLADLAEDIGICLPTLSDKTISEIREYLPPYSNISNPLDAWGNGDLGKTYANCLAALGRDPGVDLVAVCLDMQAGTKGEQAEFYKTAAHSIADVAGQLEKPVIVFSNISGGLHPGLHAILEQGEVPVLQGSAESLRAIAHWFQFSTSRGTPVAPGQYQRNNERAAAAASLLTGASLSEHASKEVLKLYAIPVTPEKLVTSLEEAQEAISELGFPVALKVDSADLPHKTEADVIRLNITDSERLAKAYGEIMAKAEKAVIGAKINGVLVEEMLNLDDAVEVIAGVSVDPQCGPVVLFGLGGIFAEALTDVALRVAPLSEADAWSMLNEIRGTDLLAGARGKPPVDRAAIVEVLQKLSDLAMELGEQISEVDINPLVVYPEGKGVVAADALIVTTTPQCFKRLLNGG